MVRKACEDYQSNIWYIICKKSLKVSGISVAVSSFSGRQNVEYHFTAFNSPLVDPPIFIRFVLKIPCPFFPFIFAIRFIIRAVNVCIPCMCIHNLVSKEGISFTFYHCFQFHFYHHIKSRSCIYGKVRICLL